MSPSTKLRVIVAACSVAAVVAVAGAGSSAQAPIGPSIPTSSVPFATSDSATTTIASAAAAAPTIAATSGSAGTWPVPAGQLHHKVGEATTGPNPKQVAFTPNGKELWTPLLGSTGVDVFSVPELKKIARIRLGTYGGVEVVFTRDSKRAYVSQMQTASVYEIDVATKRVLRVLKSGGNWTKVLELSPDERTLYAANWVSDDISVIDLASGSVTARIPTVDTPRGLIVTDDGKSLYVAGFEDGEIARVDLVVPGSSAANAGGSTTTTPLASSRAGANTSTTTLKGGAKASTTVLFKTGGAMRHLALDRTKNLLYADDMGRDTVYIVDLATNTTRIMAGTDSHPNTIDLSPDARYLYVSNRGHNSEKGYNQFGPDFGSVIVFDTTTGTAVDAIVGGNQTTGLDVSPDGTYLAFTDFQDARVQLYAIPTPDVLAKSDGARVKTYKKELLRKKK